MSKIMSFVKESFCRVWDWIPLLVSSCWYVTWSEFPHCVALLAAQGFSDGWFVSLKLLVS